MAKRQDLYDDYIEPSASDRNSQVEGYTGNFLTRAQRNQAAFAKAVTARCGCREEGCTDCSNHEMWKGLLAADAAEHPREY